MKINDAIITSELSNVDGYTRFTCRYNGIKVGLIVCEPITPSVYNDAVKKIYDLLSTRFPEDEYIKDL